MRMMHAQLRAAQPERAVAWRERAFRAKEFPTLSNCFTDQLKTKQTMSTALQLCRHESLSQMYHKGPDTTPHSEGQLCCIKRGTASGRLCTTQAGSTQ